MTYLVIKDKRKRGIVDQNEQKLKILKCIVSNSGLPMSVRWNAVLKLTELPVDSSKVRIVNRCIITGRKNSIRHLKISRMVFKLFAQKGLLTGFKKHNW